MPKNKLPKKFINSAQKCGINTILTHGAGIPHLYIESNKIISTQKISGLKISTENFQEGVKIKLVVKKGVLIKKPIFFCFGILKEKGKQIILSEIILEQGAKAKIFAHCTFPQAKNVFHQMEAKIKLKENAELVYQEKHYHGENFGAEVLANFKILIGKGATFENEFILDQGSIGKLKINLKTELEKNAFCEIINKIIGKGKKDDIEIYDKVLLNKENSRSLIKLRGAAVDGGKMFFRGETIAEAKNACGHIDCQEIVVGNSIAQSVPIIKVNHPEARITHEASVGKVNQKELETLMTRGLSEEEAIDFIIRGVVKI
jgi:Fe-S cluster assembly scaffold protein SufB